MGMDEAGINIPKKVNYARIKHSLAREDSLKNMADGFYFLHIFLSLHLQMTCSFSILLNRSSSAGMLSGTSVRKRICRRGSPFTAPV